jgi:hypothetical protein
MADTPATDSLTPSKQSTVANLLTSARTKITSLFASDTTGAKVAGGSSSSSFFASPLLWAGVVLAAAAVWFLKFRKPGRKAVKWRK